MDVTADELQALYTWVDEIPLSRPKRNIARDFSDGVMMAELVYNYFPKLVELHNYSSANGTTQKMYNWSTLNQKVFKRLGFHLGKPEQEAVVNCQPGAVERVLKLVKLRLEKAKEEGFTGNPAPPTMVGPDGIAASRSLSASAEGYPQQSTYAQPRPAAGMLGGSFAAGVGAKGGNVASEVLAEKDQTISELKETNEILETKVRKLEQLVRLKDAKIATMTAKMQAAGLS